MTGRNARVFAVVRRIPRGRVATYGQVAALAGLAGMARQVGYALHDLPDGSAVPWHRVVNARGEVSARSQRGPEAEQRLRLELEGVRFDGRGRIDLEACGWPARRRAPAGARTAADDDRPPWNVGAPLRPPTPGKRTRKPRPVRPRRRASP